ncbi:MAG: nucleotidyltransferase [Deltaproteobacteria bacterium]|nr:MAG: nucleotidyltransferase [Deltaproteobacteria bacterium]
MKQINNDTEKQLEKIKGVLKDLKREIRNKYKAELLGIFGSFARGEQTSKSDLDVLVLFDTDATLFDFVGLAIFLEEKLGIKVDIVPQDTLRKEIKEKVLSDVVPL